MNEQSAFQVKVDLSEMLKGGAIFTVSTPEQAKIAEDAGAIAVIACEPLKNDTLRMANPKLICQIQEAVSIPVVAACRIGHFVEAQILEALFIDFIDECELLTPADETNYIDKHPFKVPFVCSCSNLEEALCRIAEGAAMVRTKGPTLVEAVKQLRAIHREIRLLTVLDSSELIQESIRLRVPYKLVKAVVEGKKLPVPLFGSGGVATPADGALLIQLGAESVWVGLDVFENDDPFRCAKEIVAGIQFHNDPEMLAKISGGLYPSLPLIDLNVQNEEEIFAEKEW